jgi:hypothetical protein
MPDYAGYAAAVTIRDRIFNDALLSAYHAGQTSHTLAKSFQQLPSPTGSLNLFLQPTRVIFSATDHTHVVMRLGGWGTIGLRVSPFPAPFESRTVQWQADLLVLPRADSIGTIVFLSAKKTEYHLADWQFDVLSGTAFSAAAQAYLIGGVFKDQLQTWMRDSVGDLLFPIVDFSFLGPFSGPAFTNIAVRAVNDALVLGFDIDDGVFATTGDPANLADFAGNDDVAVVVNPAAIDPLMSTARQQVQAEVEKYDATLDSLSITCEQGQFRVTGRASMTGGAANFSLAALPLMTHTRPGAFIPLAKQTMLVKARTWPALSFVAADTSVDIDRSDWLALVEVIGGVATLGFIPFAVESFISDIVRNITGGIASGNLNPGGPTPRVRRFGDPPTRFKIERFEIHTTGVLIGITSRLEAPAPDLSGLRSIPRNFANRSVRYEVRLPFEALPDDPLLRIRWTVVDLDSGSILLNDDAAALNRLSIEFAPAALGAQVNRFAVGCRAYRALGPFMTELLNETIRLEVGPPLPPGAFTRWRYDVKNPQIGFDGATETYSYRGDQVVRRWSKFHRADKPCQNAQHRSRYTYSDEVLDNLPFPINDMNGNRYRLCDYCFFGGPASTISTL